MILGARTGWALPKHSNSRFRAPAPYHQNITGMEFHPIPMKKQGDALFSLPGLFQNRSVAIKSVITSGNMCNLPPPPKSNKEPKNRPLLNEHRLPFKFGFDAKGRSVDSIRILCQKSSWYMIVLLTPLEKNASTWDIFPQFCGMAINKNPLKRPPELPKKPSSFPLYWLVNRDPYNGLL